MYTRNLSEAQKMIVSGFNQKGWQIYRKQKDPERTIVAGPVDSLISEEKYVILPNCQESKNPEKVLPVSRIMGMPFIVSGIQEAVVVEEDPDKNADLRTIRVGELLHFPEFQPTKEFIHLHTPWKLIIPYNIFGDLMPGLIDVSKMKVPERKPSSWEEVRSFDDLVTLTERELLSKLEIKDPCKHLRRQGSFWNYCSRGIKRPSLRKPIPGNPVYEQGLGIEELTIFCVGNYDKCMHYP